MEQNKLAEKEADLKLRDGEIQSLEAKLEQGFEDLESKRIALEEEEKDLLQQKQLVEIDRAMLKKDWAALNQDKLLLEDEAKNASNELPPELPDNLPEEITINLGGNNSEETVIDLVEEDAPEETVINLLEDDNLEDIPSPSEEEIPETKNILDDFPIDDLSLDTHASDKLQIGDEIDFSENLPTKEIDMNVPRPDGKTAIRMPNGMVGRRYKFSIDPKLHELDHAIIFEIQGLASTGLKFDLDSLTVFGEPTQDGDKTLTLVYEKLEEGGKLERKIGLLINPDPKSLWKNIDPPSAEPFFKKNEDTASLKHEAYNVVAASKRGRSHAHEGSFRDDHFKIAELQDDWIFLAVADGAGSAKYSREGSRIACEKFHGSLDKALKEKDLELERAILNYSNTKDPEEHTALRKLLYEIFGSALFEARNKIVETAQANNHQLRDYSTTLLTMIVRDFSFGRFVCCYCVGDGAAGIYTHNKEIILLNDPDGGEFAGQTRFITMKEITQSEDIWNRIRFEVVDDFSSIVLMTDGVSDPIFQTDNNLKDIKCWDEFWDKLNSEVDIKADNASEQLLNWLDFWSSGNHDDRTLSILYKD